MYSFNALADVPVSHEGFWLIVALCVFILLVTLWQEAESFFVMFFVAVVVCGIAYGVSYHWTSQEGKTSVNEKVVAKFVGYQPEGYNERSGKSRVDRHYMYVVYEVDGGMVVLKAEEGVAYPKETTLYKN